MSRRDFNASRHARGRSVGRPGSVEPDRTDTTQDAAPFYLAVWGIVFLALAVRLLHVWQIRRSPFFDVLMGDAKGYDAWAGRLAGGDWVGHEVFYQAPLYPYFLGALYGLVGRSLLVVRVVQTVIGAGTCGLLALATRRFLGGRTGVVAGLALALYAPAIFFDGLLQKSVLDSACLALALWVAGGLLGNDALAEGAAGRRWFGLGLALGALSLTRENALVFIAVIAGWIAWRKAPSGVTLRSRASAAVAFGLGLFMMLAPVAIRNAIVGGGFYLTTSQFGPNFYIGNNPMADGTYASVRFGRGSPEYEQQDATTLAERAVGRTLAPAEVSSYWTGRALDFIATQPGRWLALMGRKAVLLVNAREMLDTESQESYAEWSLPLRLLGWFGHFGTLVPLAVLGAGLLWRRRRRIGLLYVMTGLYAVSVLVFYVFARYRLPLVPLLLPFAAESLLWTWRTMALREPGGERAPVWAFAAAALIAVPANWPMLSGPLMRAITETNLAAELHAAGRLDEAVTHDRLAIALQSDYAPAYNNLGVALRAQGKLDEAIATYQRAVAMHGEYPDAHYNLANAFLARGDATAAAAEFAFALRAIPDEAGIRNNLGIALAQQGKLKEALDAMRSAVAADPGSAIAHRNLGDLLVASGQPEAGLAELVRATELDPNDEVAHYNLGLALLDAERLEQAVIQFRAALAIAPGSEDAHNNLGIALGGLGRIGEAEAQFKAALAANPGSAEARKNVELLRDLTRKRESSAR